MSITDDLDDEEVDRIVEELCAVTEYENFLNTHDLETLTDDEQNHLLELWQRQRYQPRRSEAESF